MTTSEAPIDSDLVSDSDTIAPQLERRRCAAAEQWQLETNWC
jgi:hypothetical protein